MREDGRKRVVVAAGAGTIGAALAMAAADAISFGAGDDMILGAPRPGEGKARQPTPPYQPKIPTTAADHERLRLAEEKRARKARKRGFAPVGSVYPNSERTK